MSILLNAEKALKEKKYKEAYSLYSSALPDEGNKASILERMATCLYNLGRNDEALETANRALELDKNFAQTHLILAYIFGKKGDLNEGEKELKITLGLEPNMVKALVLYGKLLIAKNDLPGALSVLQKATELDSANALVHYNIGLAYHLQKHYKNALSHYKISFQKQPSVVGFLRLTEIYSAIYPIGIFLIAFAVFSLYIKLFWIPVFFICMGILIGVLRVLWERDKGVWVYIFLEIFFLFVIYGFQVLGWGR